MMSDLISRQAAIEALRTCYDTETVTYKAKSISKGKEVKGELAYDGLSCFIIERFPYGTSTVRVDPNTIEKVESDADSEI